jgi:hypothetical protein
METCSSVIEMRSVETPVSVQLRSLADLNPMAHTIYYQIRFVRQHITTLTLYFQRFKIPNPLKLSHKASLEEVLAAEAAQKEKAEQAAKKTEIKRVTISSSTSSDGSLLMLLRKQALPRLRSEKVSGEE